MKIKEPKSNWIDKSGVFTYTVYDDKGREFYGNAICAEVDRDMKSEKTGFEIASRRAKIEVLKQHVKDLKFEKKVLNDLLSTYKNHPKYEELSSEWCLRILKTKIYALDCDIKTFKSMIRSEYFLIKQIINTKESFYQKVRKARELKNKNNEA